MSAVAEQGQDVTGHKGGSLGNGERVGGRPERVFGASGGNVCG